MMSALVAMFGRTQIAEILVIHGADIDFLLSDGSIISLAIVFQHSEIANLLLNSGASLNACCRNGLFPIESSLGNRNNSLFKSTIFYHALK